MPNNYLSVFYNPPPPPPPPASYASDVCECVWECAWERERYFTNKGRSETDEAAPGSLHYKTALSRKLLTNAYVLEWMNIYLLCCLPV